MGGGGWAGWEGWRRRVGERRGGGEGSGACKIIVKDVVIVWRWGGGRGDESFSWGGGRLEGEDTKMGKER